MREYIVFNQEGGHFDLASKCICCACAKCGYPSVPENILRVFIGLWHLVKLRHVMGLGLGAFKNFRGEYSALLGEVLLRLLSPFNDLCFPIFASHKVFL